MKIGDVLSLALLGALGYAGYMLYSGTVSYTHLTLPTN